MLHNKKQTCLQNVQCTKYNGILRLGSVPSSLLPGAFIASSTARASARQIDLSSSRQFKLPSNRSQRGYFEISRCCENPDPCDQKAYCIQIVIRRERDSESKIGRGRIRSRRTRNSQKSEQQDFSCCSLYAGLCAFRRTRIDSIGVSRRIPSA